LEARAPFLEPIFLPFCPGFNGVVPEIPNPAGQPQTLGLVLSEVSVTDSLHVPLNQNMEAASHVMIFSNLPGQCGKTL
jgi:hypothetical protein